METKRCNKCGRELPLNTDYFFKKCDTKDGFKNICKECMGSKFTDKLTHISKDGYKFCIKCGRELPISIIYFPNDKACKDGFRNVCRECGADGHFMKEDYEPIFWWTKEENELFKQRYPDYTNKELIELFYPDKTEKNLSDKAYYLGCEKSRETYLRGREIQAKIVSQKNKGRIVSEETRKKVSKTRKEKYKNGTLISPWKGRIVSLEERKKMSERKKGIWSGENNPRHMQPLKGKDNGRWLGGIKELYYDLRDHLQEWKHDSMEACGYKCVLTGNEFNEIHHLYPFRNIVDELFKNIGLDIRKRIGDYNEDDVDKIYAELNRLHKYYGTGVCLTKEIHKLFHDEYGYYDTTPEQFDEFKQRYLNGEFREVI